MNKKFKISDTDFTVYTSVAITVNIGAFRFIKDEEYPWIEVYLITYGEEPERICEIDGDISMKINTLEELQIFALNWVFNNVEITSPN